MSRHSCNLWHLCCSVLGLSLSGSTWIESAKETKLRELSFHASAGMEFGLGDTALPVQLHVSGPRGLR